MTTATTHWPRGHIHDLLRYVLRAIGAPIAHVGLHTAAVLHSYDTDTFLPPHETTEEAR